MAFAVHPTNKVRKLAPGDLVGALNGKMRTWSELGGADTPIRPVYVRAAGGVTQVVVSQLLDGKPITAPGGIGVDTPMQVVKVLVQEPGALALTQNRLAKDLGLAELDIGAQIVQELSLVTMGEPGKVIAAVIRATRDVADKKFAEAR